ncbi:MAG: metallophosphoesterase [Gemmatimonadetes bacterium]|nr:metallophosphoesterase [Gemmatimonadota bacterium]
MTFSLLHLSDPHFGEVCDLTQVEAVQALIPDLEPRVIVISGDLSLRARHGEFQAARVYIKDLERTAPVYVMPGNHDVQWWWRPFIPFGPAVKYRKYRRYFGPTLAPTMDLPEAVIAGALTSHGVAWGSLTPRLRDIAVKGHLPNREIKRVTAIFAKARPEQARVLVVHHNVLRGDLSQRMGLARWRQAQRRILQSGADLVLCGHDHQEQVDMLDRRIVVSCSGTLSNRSRGLRPSAFHRITVDHESVQTEVFRWDPARKLFRRSDVFAFARYRPAGKTDVAPVVG